MAHLRFVADPDAADHHTQRRHQQRGLWLASTWEAMVAVDGVLDPEAGQRLLVALEPLAHPRRRRDPRASQRRADASPNSPAAPWKPVGWLPRSGGVRGPADG
jgi:hypothetical protein